MTRSRSDQPPLPERVQFDYSDAITLRDISRLAPRFDHDANGQPVLRADMSKAQELLQDNLQPTHLLKATAVWQLPTLKNTEGAMKTVGYIVNDWQLSSVWTAATGSPYAAAFSYQGGGSSVNLTGSPDFGSRIQVVGAAGEGCSDNQFAQFNALAFAGPVAGSTGLESSNNYLKGCFSSVIDLSIQRIVRLGGGRSVTFRIDMFNMPNNSQITGRVNSMTMNSQATNTTIVNNQYNADGSVNQTRVQPQNAGFGAANSWQAPRTMQAYIRFSF